MKNGDLVVLKVKTVREGHASQDEDDEGNSYEERIVRSRKVKRAPDKTVDTSESEAASSKGVTAKLTPKHWRNKNTYRIIGSSLEMC